VAADEWVFVGARGDADFDRGVFLGEGAEVVEEELAGAEGERGLVG
jgi:hypothetical protein